MTSSVANYYNVFEYLSSGVPTLEAVSGGTAGSTNPPVAFAVPAGSARSKTGDPTRRFLGTFLSTGEATNHVRPFRCDDIGGGNAEFTYLSGAGAGSAPFKVLAAGTAGSFTAIDFSGILPNNGTVYEAFLSFGINGASGSGNIYIGRDSSGYLGFYEAQLTAAVVNSSFTGWVPINSNTTTGLYYQISASATLDVFVFGAYRFRR